MSVVVVVGAGYVGLTTAACLADLGNEVRVVDVDAARVAGLRRGEVPFFEPGLQETVRRNLEAGRLSATTDYGAALAGAAFAFLAVPTPQGPDGQADLDHVREAAAAIAANVTGPLIVINKSTVPIGTGDLVGTLIAEAGARHLVKVVSNPEFLREGSAMKDFMEPERVVIGSADRAAAEEVARLYRPLNAPILITGIYTAEMIKYASNAFLATKISFINHIAQVCERVGADVEVVAEGMGLDARIGHRFLAAGIGFGGSCFPKDIQALAAIAEESGVDAGLLRSVMRINQEQRRSIVLKLEACLGGCEGTVIGLLGLAFKPNTDDLREAPSLDIAAELRSRGAVVRAYDPVAMPKAAEMAPEIIYCRSPYEAADGADALVVVTEWNEFRQLDTGRLRAAMRRPVLIDGRNIYDPERMRSLGFTYRGVGRP